MTRSGTVPTSRRTKEDRAIVAFARELRAHLEAVHGGMASAVAVLVKDQHALFAYAHAVEQARSRGAREPTPLQQSTEPLVPLPTSLNSAWSLLDSLIPEGGECLVRGLKRCSQRYAALDVAPEKRQLRVLRAVLDAELKANLESNTIVYGFGFGYSLGHPPPDIAYRDDGGIGTSDFVGEAGRAGKAGKASAPEFS